MSALLALPFFLRLLLLFVVGACLGGLINLAIYRLAYDRRRISPWGFTKEKLPRRGWVDRIPIFGWWNLRREAEIHGRGFWVRPILIEICFALTVVALYVLEIDKFALNMTEMWPGRRPIETKFFGPLHVQFAIHVVLLALMSVATFIDIDEQTIPDAVTVPGTAIALLLALLCTSPALPALNVDPNLPRPENLVSPLRFDYAITSANEMTTFLPNGVSLAVGLAIYWAWCFALLPRRWRMGVGMRKAWRVMWRRIAVRSEWTWILPLAVAGTLMIVPAWAKGGEPWRGLMTALVGLAAGGGMIWIIRLIGSAMLKQEAMGFGDVTLMAMIGAFFGWQPVIVVFFIAPFVGVLFGAIQWLLFRQNVLPYGPFLCLAALVTLLFWGPVWDTANRVFEIPWLVPAAIGVCLPLLAAMLYGWRELKNAFSNADF